MISMVFLKLPPKEHVLHYQFLYKQVERTFRSASGSMCDAEKEWHECSFHASAAINGSCQKFPLNESEIKFSFFSLSACGLQLDNFSLLLPHACKDFAKEFIATED